MLKNKNNFDYNSNNKNSVNNDSESDSDYHSDYNYVNDYDYDYDNIKDSYFDKEKYLDKNDNYFKIDENLNLNFNFKNKNNNSSNENLLKDLHEVQHKEKDKDIILNNCMNNYEAQEDYFEFVSLQNEIDSYVNYHDFENTFEGKHFINFIFNLKKR
jgi:hypothetical protein